MSTQLPPRPGPPSRNHIRLRVDRGQILPAIEELIASWLARHFSRTVVAGCRREGRRSGKGGTAPEIFNNEIPILDGVDQTGYGIIVGGISTNFVANYVNISGITVHDYETGILVREASNVHISKVTVYNMPGTDNGVFFLDSNTCSIMDSVVRDIGWNAIGVQINYISAHHIDIVNNEVYGGIDNGHNLIDLNNNGTGNPTVA